MRFLRLKWTALALAFAIPLSQPARSNALCDAIAIQAAKQMAKYLAGRGAGLDPVYTSDLDLGAEPSGLIKADRIGAVKAAFVAINALAAYIKTPGDEAFNTAMNALANGTAGLVFTPYGLALKAGKMVVAGVEYTVDAGESGRMQAALCGGASFNDAFSVLSFFDLNAVKQLSPGLTCDNFGDRGGDRQKLAALKALWDGFYARTLREIEGEQNRESVDRKLSEGWATLELKWKLQQGAKLYAEVRGEIDRQARELAANKQCVEGVAVDPAVEAKQKVEGPASLAWSMELAGKVTADGAVTGNYASWGYSGRIIEPPTVSGTVTCEGLGGGYVESNGVFAANVKCQAAFKYESHPESTKWTLVGRGLINWDDLILKGGGRGTRVDSPGVSYSDLGAELHIRALAKK